MTVKLRLKSKYCNTVCVLCVCVCARACVCSGTEGRRPVEILQYKSLVDYIFTLYIYVLFINLLFHQNCFCVVPSKLFHIEFGETTRDQLHNLTTIFFKEWLRTFSNRIIFTMYWWKMVASVNQCQWLNYSSMWIYRC